MENHLKLSVQEEFIFRSTKTLLRSKYLAMGSFILKI